MSAPLDSSGSQSPDLNRDNLLSPTSASHPLPPRPSSNISSTIAATATDDNQDTPADAPSTLPQQTKIRGGFEVDDDDEGEDQEDDGQDDADVYDPEAAGLDIEASTPALDQTPIDRQSQSPIQRNGITPVSAQPVDSPAGASSSHLQSGSSLPTADADPSAQAVAAVPVSPTPLRSSVNGSLSAVVAKSSRLAHDTIGILEDRIKEDPRGDPGAYFELIQEYKNRNKQDDVRATFDRYLAVFPRDAATWCTYLKWEESHDQKSRMEQIFNKILPKLLNVDLWMIYINHVRRTLSSNRDETIRQKTIDNVFTFSLSHIGIDKDAGSVWQEYIAFLKTGPGTLGGGAWQDGAKADSIRAAYQKAIAIPTEAVTQLWRDYDMFENSLSKINGRKHLQEMSASYMTARQAHHQLSNSTAGLNRTTQPRLPPRPGYQGDDEWSHQLDLWYTWLDFEKGDPLILKDDDREAYLKRVTYVYKQALMALQFWPGMWYSAAEFCLENGMDKEAVAFLEDGIAANPESPLLAFKLADRIESTTQNDETSDPGAKDRMKKVRQPYDGLLDRLYSLLATSTQRERDQVQQLEAESQNTNGGDVDDEVNAANVSSKKAALDAQIAIVKAAAADENDLLTKLISHVWIAIARATRRVQGRGDPSNGGFRAVFNEARKRGRLTSHFYVEYGAMEWQCYDAEIGSKILERGMKLYADDEYLPLQYIKYLFDKKQDVTNARGVFETTVTRLTAAGHPERTRSLFHLMHDYESRFGDLSQMQKLEQRMRELFPDDTSIGLFSDRFATQPFDPVVRFPVVSKSQIQPKAGGVLPSIEGIDKVESPMQKTIDSYAVNSPKRPLPDDFEDNQARKFARGESPLKGAAGRKMQQRQTNAPAPAPSALPPPLPPPLPPQIHYLLSILPKPQYYTDARFDAAKMANLLRDVHLPTPGQLPAHHTPQPQPAMPAWPHQPTHPQPHHFPPPGHPPMPGQPYMQPPTPAQNQYGGAPFRFA